MTSKLVAGYSRLQTLPYWLKSLKKDKKGQAVMEYGVIFVVAGMGLALSLSLIQDRIAVALMNQLQQLIYCGKNFF